MDSSTLKAFRDYSKISYFQKEAMSILVKHLNLDEIKELNQLFFSLDQNNVGSISMSLLARTMSSFGFNLAKKELKNLITSLDIDNDGKINYSEFLAATYYSKHHLQQEELWATFTHFDVYRKGYITSQDLEFCLSRSGHYTKEKELEGIMKDLGIDQDAKIQFDEFVKLFFPINNSST